MRTVQFKNKHFSLIFSEILPCTLSFTFLAFVYVAVLEHKWEMGKQQQRQKEEKSSVLPTYRRKGT